MSDETNDALDRVTALLDQSRTDIRAGRAHECLRSLDEAQALASGLPDSHPAHLLLRGIKLASDVVRSQLKGKLT